MTRPRSSLGVAVLVLGFPLLGAAACSDPLTPQKVPDCMECHDLASLTAPVSSEPLREWTGLQGRGLVRRPVMIQTDAEAFEAPLPRRGNHTEMAAAYCVACHPVSEQGIRHGLRIYPREARGRVFGSATDCAASCHGWLPVDAISTGFTPASGAPPEYSGSLRPHALLTGADNAHAVIYREGFVRDGGFTLLISRLKSGCGGCHNVRNEFHGTINSCVQCHRFGDTSGRLHTTHLDAIESGRDANDLDHAAEVPCSYCHGFGPVESDLKNAACYSCHLSGHQPLNDAGQAHFWPLP
ncbi:MAG: hypothetical protein ABI333_22075 [bacterium]